VVTATELPGGDDTIVALATAAGQGAIALIRLSGARAIMIARAPDNRMSAIAPCPAAVASATMVSSPPGSSVAVTT